MKKRIISILLAVCMMLCLAQTSVFAEGTGDVAINEINFPDENFRNFVSSNYDKSGSGVLSAEKIAGITEIFVLRKKLKVCRELNSSRRWRNCVALITT